MAQFPAVVVLFLAVGIGDSFGQWAPNFSQWSKTSSNEYGMSDQIDLNMNIQYSMWNDVQLKSATGSFVSYIDSKSVGREFYSASPVLAKSENSREVSLPSFPTAAFVLVSILSLFIWTDQKLHKHSAFDSA